MSLLFYLLGRVAKALIDYGPELWWKVSLVSIGYVVIAVVGAQLGLLLRPLVTAGPTEPSDRVDRVLMAFIVGAFYTLFLMYVLGYLGAFRLLPMWIGIMLPLVLNLVRKKVRILPIRIPRETIAAFVVVCLGPLIVSLTCPVPSWGDVLEGNVAPVQRLVTFGSYDAIHALPSALYPLNRATPLFTSFHGVIAVLFGLEAYQTLAAALLPSLCVTLLAAYRLGRVLLPSTPHAGEFSVLSWLLAYNYLHLQDSRSTGWQMMFGLIALTKAIELFDGRYRPRTLVAAGIACAAAILVHPFEGMFTTLAVYLILLGVLASGNVLNVRRLFLSAALTCSMSAPILWTWWPMSRIAAVGGWALLMSAPVFGRLLFTESGDNGSRQELAHHEAFRESWRRLLGFAPAVILTSSILLRWNFYGFGEKSFLIHELIRYPVPIGFSIVAVLLSVGTATRTSLLIGSSVLAASLPLWLIGFLKLSPVEVASFGYELPLKGMDFWLSSVSCVAAATVLTAMWSKPLRFGLAKVYVSAVLIIPIAAILHVPADPEHKAAGLLGMARWHLQLAANGYWRGWSDPRRVVSPAERRLYDELRRLVVEKKITESDHVSHIAPASNLLATPFPAFTGIAQDLYLPSVDTLNIHTHGGRLYDIRVSSVPSGWVLIERTMLPSARTDSLRVVYSNERVVLGYIPPQRRESF